MEDVKLMDQSGDYRLRGALSKTVTNAEARERPPALYQASKSKSNGKEGRTVPMAVLNMGMPRTGTMSMQRALNILGYNCYHGSTLLSETQDCKRWDRAMDAKYLHKGKEFDREDWDELLGSYSAISSDVPAVALVDDLIRIYPEARVILTERDVEKWFQSFSSTVTGGVWSPATHRIADWDPKWLGAMRDTHLRWARYWFKSRSREEMDTSSRQVFLDHYAMVRRITSADRLLEYKTEDGWEPICKFLGKEVPDVPFPHVNDGAALWEQMALLARRGIKNAIWRIFGHASMAIIVLAVSWWLYNAYDI